MTLEQIRRYIETTKIAGTYDECHFTPRFVESLIWALDSAVPEKPDKTAVKTLALATVVTSETDNNPATFTVTEGTFYSDKKVTVMRGDSSDDKPAGMVRRLGTYQITALLTPPVGIDGAASKTGALHLDGINLRRGDILIQNEVTIRLPGTDNVLPPSELLKLFSTQHKPSEE